MSGTNDKTDIRDLYLYKNILIYIEKNQVYKFHFIKFQSSQNSNNKH